MTIRDAIDAALSALDLDGDPAAVLADHGFGDLPPEAFSSALLHFAESAPLEVADSLSPIVARISPVPFEPDDLTPSHADTVLADGGDVYSLLTEVGLTDPIHLGDADPSGFDDDHAIDHDDRAFGDHAFDTGAPDDLPTDHAMAGDDHYAEGDYPDDLHHVGDTLAGPADLQPAADHTGDQPADDGLLPFDAEPAFAAAGDALDRTLDHTFGEGGVDTDDDNPAGSYDDEDDGFDQADDPFDQAFDPQAPLVPVEVGLGPDPILPDEAPAEPLAEGMAELAESMSDMSHEIDRLDHIDNMGHIDL